MLYSIIGFIITIGILVTIHEWGHFFVARRCGVAVERFSIGFGPVLLRRKDTLGTEWALSAIPLGGYVKMLGDSDKPIAKNLRHAAYNQKPIWKRMAIVLAGPLANLIFAYMLYVGLHVAGIKDIRPILGAPEIGSRAEKAGVVGGETVLKVDTRNVAGWSDIRQSMIDRSVDGETLMLTLLNPAGNEYEVSINVEGILQFPATEVGLNPPFPNPPAVVHQVFADSPAYSAKLQSGDRIVGINGESIESWRQMAQTIQKLPAKRINLTINRDGALQEISLLTSAESLSDGTRVGRIGIAPNAEAFQLPPELFFRHALPLPKALQFSWHKTIDTAWLIPRFIHGIFSGKVSWRHLNGPIAIADVAGRSLADGINSFIQIMAAISISLGMMNLLPLPVLDGGHFVFLLYEAITRRPPSKVALEWLTRSGVTLLLLLMVLVIYNDISLYFR